MTDFISKRTEYKVIIGRSREKLRELLKTIIRSLDYTDFKK